MAERNLEVLRGYLGGVVAVYKAWGREGDDGGGGGREVR